MENGMLNNQIPVNNNNNSNGAKGRSVAASVIIAIAILGSAAALAFGLTNFRSATSHTISATGSASKDFESNLIVWNGSYSAYAYT